MASLRHGTQAPCDPPAGTLIDALPIRLLQQRLSQAAARVPLGRSLRLRLLVDDTTAEHVLRRPRTADVLSDVFDGEAEEPARRTCGAYLSRAVLTPWLPRGVAATGWPRADGQGRLLVLLTALLAQVCNEAVDWTDVGESATRYAFFAPRSADTLRMEPTLRQNRLRLVRTLRALTQYGAVCVHTQDSRRDWWSWVLQAALQELRAHGDLHDLVTHDTANAVQWDAIAGVLHTLLSTEVDEDVARTLGNVLLRYLATPSSESVDDASRHDSLEMLQSRLTALHTRPSTVLAGGVSTCVAARPTRPPCRGPVHRTQLLPPRVVVLPDAGAGRNGTRTPLFHVHPTQQPTPGTEAALHVLLLRIDPTGGWLGAEETAYNVRTFVTHYYGAEEEAQRSRAQWAPARRRPPRATDSDEDDFATLDAASAGRRWVETSVNSHNDDNNDDVVVQEFMSLLPSTATASAEATVLRSTVRLHLWALRHSVRVILSPELAPPIMKNFGQRHLSLLRALLAAARARDASCAATDDAETELFFVDALQLESFRALQRGAASESVPVSSLIVSRDALRVSSGSALDTDAADVLVRVTRCVVTTPTDLFLHADSVEDFLRHNRALLPAPDEAEVHDTTPLRTAERICVVQLCATPLVSAAESRVMLLVAPSLPQLVLYEHLVRKCAATLHAMLLRPVALTPYLGDHDDLHTAVRAGGAFLIALSRQLRRLSSIVTAQTLVVHDAVGALCEVGMTRFVLRALAVACMAVPNKLAEGVVVRGETAAAATAGPQSSDGAESDARCAGPRARRRLWWSAQSCAMAGEGVELCTLHCYHVGLLESLPRAERACDAHSSAPPANTLSDAQLARRVFCADVAPPSALSLRTPFVESVHDNARVVLDGLDALRHIMCVVQQD